MSAPTLSNGFPSMLRNLRSDWDSYGGRPTTELAIETIGQFATVPCSDGGIQLEIHRDGFDIEIKVGPDGRIESGSVCAALEDR